MSQLEPAPAALDLEDEETFGAELEALMLELASGERFERLGAMAHEHLLTSRRRRRASLPRQAMLALGVRREVQVGWAAACELLHNASLIHDDIQDRSRLRRGSYSIWVRHGAPQAINAGDLLLMLPYLALERIPVEPVTQWQLARLLTRRAVATVRGQSLEMSLLGSKRWSWLDYELAVRGKTTVMFVLPVEGAALLSGADEAQAAKSAERFSALGLIYQLRDDVLDLYGEHKGRWRGAHLREGRISGLIVEQLLIAPQDLKWLGPLLGKHVDETSDEDVARAAEHFEASGALRGVIERMNVLRQGLAGDDLLAATPPLHALVRQLADQAFAAIEAVATPAK